MCIIYEMQMMYIYGCSKLKTKVKCIESIVVTSNEEWGSIPNYTLKGFRDRDQKLKAS